MFGGLQILHRNCSEVSLKGVVRQISMACWGVTTIFMSPTRSGISGGAFDARPHPYAVESASQIQHRFCNGIWKGKSAVLTPGSSKGIVE